MKYNERWGTIQGASAYADRALRPEGRPSIPCAFTRLPRSLVGV